MQKDEEYVIIILPYLRKPSCSEDGEIEFG